MALPLGPIAKDTEGTQALQRMSPRQELEGFVCPLMTQSCNFDRATKTGLKRIRQVYRHM